MRDINIGELAGSIITGISLLPSKFYEEALRQVFKDTIVFKDREKLSQVANVLFVLIDEYWYQTDWNLNWNGEEPEVTFQDLLEHSKRLDETYELDGYTTSNLEKNLRWLLDYGVISKDWKTQTYHLDMDFLKDYEDALMECAFSAYGTEEVVND